MNFKTNIKVNSLNNLRDARYCAGMGVGIMGFAMRTGSKEEIATISEIAGWIVGTDFVLECSGNPPWLPDALRFWSEIEPKPKYLQFDCREAAALAAAQTSSPEIVYKIDYAQFSESEPEKILAQMQHLVAFFLIKLPTGRTLSENDWEALRQAAKKYTLFVDCGLQKEKIAQLLKRVKPKGIALAVRESKDTDDFEALADVLEMLEIQD